MIVGGSVEASFRRGARFGEGWMMGGGSPDQFAEAVEGVRAAWREAGRDGEPRLMALGYFSLGADAEPNADRYLKDYYGIAGDEVAEMITSSAATDEETVRQYMDAFEGTGCDELVLFPCSSDPEQADLLADAAGK